MPPHPEESLNPAADSISRDQSATQTEYLSLNDSATADTGTSLADQAAITASRRVRRKIWLTRGVMLCILVGLIGGLTGGVLWLRSRTSTVLTPADLIRPTVLSLERGLIPAPSSSGSTTASQLAVNGDLSVNGILSLSPQAINNLGAALVQKVDLQANFPGIPQAGSGNISGTFGAAAFVGDGQLLQNLNASTLTLGTVADARLAANVTRLGQSIPLSALQTNVLASVNGVVNNGGNVQFVGSGGITITPDQTTNTVTITATSGTSPITNVIAGAGLTGGGNFGSVTLAIDSTVTVQGNSFNVANQLVQLDGSGALPAVSGTNLTNLNATAIISGTLPNTRLSSAVTVQGNSFNAANQLVQLDGSGELPSVSGGNLTNLNATAITAGTLNDTRLSANVTTRGNTFNLPSKLVQLNGSGELTALNGTNLVSLNATALSSGTVADARLSANVALLNATQTFTGPNTFTGTIFANAIQPTASMTIGSTSQNLTLQGNLNTKLTATSGANLVAVGFTGTPIGNVTYAFDAATTPGSYTVCTSVGNCASAGGGVTTLGGTTNRLTKFTGAQSVGDSSITDTGALVSIAARGLFQASSPSTTAFQIQNTAGTSNLFVADTTNSRIAIGQATASYPLDVSGDINSTTGLRVGGNLVCNSSGCNAGSGSGFYVQNGTSVQVGANFSVQSASNASVVGVVRGAVGQTADLFQAQNSSGTPLLKVTASGNLDIAGQYLVSGSQISSANLSNDANLAKLNGTQNFTGNNTFTGSLTQTNAANSTASFRIQNAAGTADVLRTDTTNSRVSIGYVTGTPPGYTLDVNGDINITTGSSYRINGVAICGPSSTCAPSAGSNNYVQNGSSLQATTNYYIQSANAATVGGIIRGATSQSANLFEARDGSNNTVLSISPSAVLTLGTPSVYSGSLVIRSASNGNTTTLTATTPTANRAISLPDEAGTLCLQSSSNCGFALSAGSGSYIQNGTSTQTANYNIQSAAAGSIGAIIKGAVGQTADLIQAQNSSGTPQFQLTSAGILNITGQYQVGGVQISSASLSNDANLAKLNGTQSFTGNNTYTGTITQTNTANSTAAFRIQNAAATTDIMRADTTNTRVGIGYSTATAPAYTLDVNGDINSATAVRVGGISVCTSSGCVASAGSGILNSTSLQTNANFNIESAATGSVTGVLKAKTSQTANIFEARDSGNNAVASIGSTGNTVFRTSTNSTSAFQVQNAASQSLFSLDTTNSKASFNSAANGEVTPWTTSSNGIASAKNTASTVISNGYLYTIGGSSTTVSYQSVNANGSLGVASTTTSLPVVIAYGGFITNNGYLYATNGGSANVYYARINTDGTLGSWITTASLPANSYGVNQLVTANGYLYLYGGGPSYTSIYLTTFNADGSLNAWTTSATVLPAGRALAGTVVVNGYVIVTGGSSDTSNGQATVYTAKLNANGTIGAFTTTTALPAAVYVHSAVTMNGYVYVMGGSPNTLANSVATVYYGRVSSSGTISSWTTAANALPAPLGAHNSAVANGYIYTVGGFNTVGTAQSTIYYTSGARVQMIGALDLIGQNGGALSDAPGMGGGSIYAGRIFSNNDLEVLGNTTLNGGATINGTLSLKGSSVFQSATNSTTAYQFQNAAGAVVWSADTTNRRIGINTATPLGTLDVRPAAVGDIGLFIRQFAATTADILQFQNSSSTLLFAIDATGAIVSGDALGGPPIIGVDPNSGSTTGDYVSSTGPLGIVGTPDGFGNFYTDVQPGTVYTANVGQTAVNRCTVPSAIRLGSTGGAFWYVYVTADSTTGANGRTCTLGYSVAMPTFNAKYPIVVIGQVCVNFAGFTCSYIDLRWYKGGVLSYVNTSAAVSIGDVVINDTASDNRVVTTTSAASTGVAGVIVVGNTGAGKAIMMTQGLARTFSGGAATARGACVQTSTTAGRVQVTNSPSVGTCVGQALTAAGGGSSQLLVRVAPY